MKKWLICGDRNAPASHSKYVNDILDRLIILEGRPYAIAEGEAPGYDSLAKNWAKDRRVECKGFPADWRKHGNSAGPLRNQQMLEEFQPNLVVAFPGRKGTADMIQRARKAGIKVLIVPTPKELGYN